MKKVAGCLLSLLMFAIPFVASATADSVSEKQILTHGFYVVGEDIDAGSYQVIAGDFGSNSKSFFYIYADRNEFEEVGYFNSGKLSLGDEPFSLNLEDGNVLSIEGLPLAISASGFSEDDYPKYTPPEGTLVPSGIYRGGIDIPVGIYQVYSTSIAPGSIVGYRTEEKYQEYKDSISEYNSDFTIEYYPRKPEQIQTIEVEEGNVLIVTGDAIMKRPEKLEF